MAKGNNPDRLLAIYNKHTILVHILFWLVYLLVITVLSATFYDRATFTEIFLQLSVSLWIDVAATYFTAYYLLPKFLLKKKYLLFSGLMLLSVVGFVLIQRAVQIYISWPLFYPESTMEREFFDFNPAYSVVNIYAVVFIVTSARLFKYWFINQNRAFELEKQKVEAELKYLKSQVHPHFLFNTLNNLYALTLDKSDLAPAVVLRLSDLLSYMLYDANERTVPLQKEIALIDNYIELETLRRGGELNIDYQKDVDQPMTPVAPLLFIPFIENSFKHGVWNDAGQPEMAVKLIIKDYHLYFEVSNTIGPDPEGENVTRGDGIGLKNVQRRLEILYPENHNLTIEERNGKYIVILELELLTDEDEGKVFIG